MHLLENIQLEDGFQKWHFKMSEFIDSDDIEEVYCNLCGYGFDTMKDVKRHHFEEHYDLLQGSVTKDWFEERES